MTKVFLSYRHEVNAAHPDHQKRVKELGQRLLCADLEATVDQIYAENNPGGPNEGWPSWCEAQATNADKVLIVASAGYFRCYENKEEPGEGLGAACEINIIRNARLYATGYKPDTVRIVYFDHSHLAHVPDALSHIHHFDATDPSGLNDLIAWLKGPAPKDSTACPADKAAISWPPHLAGYAPELANRREEFGFFTSMLTGITAERAMFLQGPSDHGKTKMVAECMKYAKKTLGAAACVAVDFKGSPTREVALETLSLGLSSLLPNFGKPGSQSRQLRSDLRSLVKPALLLFDTFEQSSSDAQEIIQGLLLADLDLTPSVRIVIAGQTVPEHTKTLWAKWVRLFSLGPIINVQDWVAYAQRSHPELQPTQIQTLTSATGGEPGIMTTLIRGLARAPQP